MAHSHLISHKIRISTQHLLVFQLSASRSPFTRAGATTTPNLIGDSSSLAHQPNQPQLVTPRPLLGEHEASLPSVIGPEPSLVAQHDLSQVSGAAALDLAAPAAGRTVDKRELLEF